MLIRMAARPQRICLCCRQSRLLLSWPSLLLVLVLLLLLVLSLEGRSPGCVGCSTCCRGFDFPSTPSDKPTAVLPAHPYIHPRRCRSIDSKASNTYQSFEPPKGVYYRRPSITNINPASLQIKRKQSNKVSSCATHSHRLLPTIISTMGTPALFTGVHPFTL